MTVDVNDPKFPEYIAECEILGEWFIAEEKLLDEEDEKEYPGWKGLDHPNGGKRKALTKEFTKRLKDLQKKYGF